MDEIKGWGFGALAVIAVMLFFSSCTTVPAGNRGVVTHWGAVDEATLSEGLHFVAPIGTSVHDFSVRTSKDEVQASAASRDLQEVKSHVAVNWHPDIEKVSAMYQKLGNRDAVLSNIITPAVNEVLKAATARLSAEEILKKREQLKTEVDNGLKARLAPYGVIVDDISLVNLTFSDEFNEAIEAKQVAEQEAQKAVYEAQKAQNEATASVNRARGEAQAQALQRNTITPELIKLKALEVQKMAVEKWNGVMPTVSGGVTPFLNMQLTTP